MLLDPIVNVNELSSRPTPKERGLNRTNSNARLRGLGPVDSIGY